MNGLTSTHLELATQLIQERCGAPPSTAIVLGSGLSGLVDRLTDPLNIPFEEVGLPPVGVAGHGGSLVVGHLDGVKVAMLAGRVHVYEGREAEEVVRAVRAMAAWGVERVVLTNAVGAVDPSLSPGSLVAVSDHINMMGMNPLVGPPPATGERFPDLSAAYTPALRAEAIEVAGSLGTPLREGIYAAMRGPSYETPAEIRMLGLAGASTVGMSTVPEVIALCQLGVPVLVINMVSNLAAGHATEPLTHEEVTETASKAGEGLARLIEALVLRWG